MDLSFGRVLTIEARDHREVGKSSSRPQCPPGRCGLLHGRSRPPASSLPTFAHRRACPDGSMTDELQRSTVGLSEHGTCCETTRPAAWILRRERVLVRGPFRRHGPTWPGSLARAGKNRYWSRAGKTILYRPYYWRVVRPGVRTMTRYVAIFAVAWMLVGCRAPAPSFDLLAPYGSPTVPPPRTGSIGTAGTYYAPTTPGTQSPATVPTAPTTTTPAVTPQSRPAAPPAVVHGNFERDTVRRDDERGTSVLPAWVNTSGPRTSDHGDRRSVAAKFDNTIGPSDDGFLLDITAQRHAGQRRNTVCRTSAIQSRE